MQVYRDIVMNGLEGVNQGDFSYSLINEGLNIPDEVSNKGLKFYYKYYHLKKQVRDLGADKLVHHLDHGYAHLIQDNQRSVVTVHDLTHFAYPELVGRALSSWRRRMQCLKKARHLVAVSQNVADLLVKHLEIPASLITVAYHEIDVQKLNGLNRERVRDKWQVRSGTDYTILSVGTNDPKKNLPTLLKAVNRLRKEGLKVKLIRVGTKLEYKNEPHQLLVEELKKQGVLMELGFLPHHEVLELLCTCDVFSFPSAYEGFGLPIIEAQAAKIPLVCSSASCLPEIAGEGALYHDTEDEITLSRHLKALLTNNELSESIIDAGVTNLSRFQAPCHISPLLDIYKGL